MAGIVLGQKYTDSITGFSGIAIARCVFLNGCVRVDIQPVGLKDGNVIESRYIDEQQLTEDSPALAGGPQSAPTRPKDPPKF